MEMAEKTLYEMVQKAASLHSTRTAVTFDSCTNMGIVSRTYKELQSLADELTNLLKEQGCQNEHIFGLYCHPGINLPNWILGIIQLPAAYAPLDPDSPPLLSVRVMDQCGLAYAVIQSDLLQRFQSTFSPHQIVRVCEVWQSQGLTLVKLGQKAAGPLSHEQSLSAELSSGSQGALAYVLHTSGTTGLPKTVRVPHQCIVPNILHLRSLFQMTAEDVVFMASPLTFDPSVVEMFLTLSLGACLLIVPMVIKKVPNRLATVLFKHHRITVIQATPTLLGRFGGSVLRSMVLSAASPLRILALGGEAFPPVSVLCRWREEGNSTRIFNLYGTTEVSCWATCHELHLDNRGLVSVPLGSPLMGTTVEVRDEDGDIVTQGEGQVFIGGQDRVCYLGDEVAVATGTMRSTGDWVEVRGSHLYYLGRRDRLVKRHGQRLHLDTLHQVLESLPQIEVCAVTLLEEKRLVAFVVPAPSSRDSAPSSRGLQREILRALAQLLPSHSHPDTILLLPALPLTSHGKVNMGELLQVYERRSTLPISHDAPEDRDSLRKHLQILWREVLSLGDDAVVGADSCFLLSGGDSLSSLRLSDDITAAVGVSAAGLLEVILNGSFSDLVNYVATATFKTENANPTNTQPSDHLSPAKAKRKNQDPPSPAQAKRKQADPVSPMCVKRLMGFVVVRRAGEVFSLGCKDQLNHHENTVAHTAGAIERTDHAHSHTAGPNERTDHAHSHTPQPNERTDHAHWHSAGPNERTSHVHSHTPGPNERTDHAHSHTPGPNERTDHAHSHTPGPNERTDHTHSHTPWPDERTDYAHSNTAGHNERTDHVHSHTTVPNLRSDHAHSHIAEENEGAGDCSTLALRVRWQSDTGRCVDASPVLLVSDSGGAVAFVGSHSHRLQALDLSGGGLLWERVLGGRIEASAAITRCGSLIVIGCYDGQVYFLAVDTGEMCWTFRTGDAVKSSPAVDILTGLVLVGSHDGHVYALDPEAQRCVWRRHCGGGAVFSSPCLHPSLRQLYVTTLRGEVLCLRPDSGAIMWTHSSTAPFFSSPCCSGSSLCIGSVDGNIYGFSHSGNLLWQFHTDGPVFSSPCSTPASLANQRVFCGSHDGRVYCLNSGDGTLVWRFQAEGRVFSSPFLFHGSPGEGGDLVAVATTDGTLWVLGADDGEPRASLRLPGEIFSSPVVWGHTLVVGCRNDFVYGVELTAP